MVIDSGDETVFRKEFYPEYKANREKPPEDFKPQEERILQLVKDRRHPDHRPDPASRPTT